MTLCRPLADILSCHESLGACFSEQGFEYGQEFFHFFGGVDDFDHHRQVAGKFEDFGGMHLVSQAERSS